MELFDEENQRQKKSSKSTTIILILIFVLIIIIITTLIMISTLKKEKFVVNVDGVPNSDILSILVFDENDPSKLYIPIREMANCIGYKDYSGEYDNLSEDTNKCYIQSETDITNFTLDSDKLYKKVISTDTNDEYNDYELETIDEPVKLMNEKLYTTIDGIEKGLNISFSYDVSKKTIDIYTVQTLIKIYTNNIVNMGYDSIDENVKNQKSVLDNIIIVVKGEKYAAIKTNGEAILEDKYDQIQYLRKTGDFIVTTGNYKGIISSDRTTKIGLEYEDIKPMDYDYKYFLVKKNEKYGVIDESGKIVIYPNYEQIGIDASQFKSNGIKNRYFLLDNYIPIQILQNDEKLWGIANKNGKLVSQGFKYEQIGYIDKGVSSEKNLLLIPDYELIVVKENEKYTVMKLNGEEVWPAVFDSIYIENTENGKKYTVTRNSQVGDLEKLLEKMGITKKIAEDESKKSNVSEKKDNTISDDKNTSE